MRGKRGYLHQGHSVLRNIPAYAGKTALMPILSTALTEHPRVCGENIRKCAVNLIAGGTSPRMRGKHLFCYLNFDESRNIPAYAGKTSYHLCREPAGGEHPRVCGENLRSLL